MNHRAHFRAEDTFFDGAAEQCIQIGHWVHQLNTVGFWREAFINFEERHHPALFPKVLCSWDAINFAVHSALEQNCAHHFVARKGR